jgi:hypothetical protein
MWNLEHRNVFPKYYDKSAYWFKCLRVIQFWWYYAYSDSDANANGQQWKCTSASSRSNDHLKHPESEGMADLRWMRQ